MHNSADYSVVLVTASSEQEADTLANAILEAHLAACVSILPVRSIYSWKGEIHKDQEWQLLIKTHLSQFSALESKIRELHSYEVPEIIAIPILAGSETYLRWIAEQVRN